MKSKEKVLEKDITLLPGKGSKNSVKGPGSFYWHIFHKNQRVGRVYINKATKDSEEAYGVITIEINQKDRSRGIGSIAYKKACELSEYSEVLAEMRKTNKASRIAAERAGFQIKKDQKGGQLKMIWKKNRNEL
ncbi:MAG: GNAT family N-acetyltransferase [Bacteroidia bacterium]